MSGSIQINWNTYLIRNNTQDLKVHLKRLPYHRRFFLAVFSSCVTELHSSTSKIKYHLRCYLIVGIFSYPQELGQCVVCPSRPEWYRRSHQISGDWLERQNSRQFEWYYSTDDNGLQWEAQGKKRRLRQQLLEIRKKDWTGSKR